MMIWPRIRRVAGLVVATILLLVPLPLHADQVSIRVSTHDGYGRIIFGWPRSVGFTARVEGKRLIVDFRRPVETTLEGLPGALSQYARRPRLSNGGRRISFPLTGNYDFRSFPEGRSIIVDLFDPEGPAPQTATSAAADTNEALPPAPVPSGKSVPTPAAQQKPANAQEVGVRTGLHTNYTRMVFDWAQRVPYQLERKGQSAVLTFESPANINLDRINRGSIPFVGGGRVAFDGRQTVVNLSVPSSSQVRHFRSGNKVVVDVNRPTRNEPAPPPPAVPQLAAAASPSTAIPPPAQPQQNPPPAAKPPTSATLPPAQPQQNPPPAAKPPTSATLPPAQPQQNPPPAAQSPTSATLPPAQPQQNPPPVAQLPTSATLPPAQPRQNPPPAAKSPTSATLPLAQPQQNPPVRAALQSAATQPLAATAQPQQTQPGPQPLSLLEPENLGASPVVLTPATSPTAANPTTPVTPASVGARTSKTQAATALTQPSQRSAITLRVDWEEPVAAAIFRRAGSLWLVFNKAKVFDVRALRETVGAVVRNLEQVPSEQAAILRLRTVEGINPSLRRDGFSWLFDFGKQALTALTAIPMQTQAQSEVGPRAFFPVAEASAAIPFADPEVGDNLVVVPVIPLGHGVPKSHQLSQFRVLASAQGVVIQPRIDQLRVRPIKSGIELFSTEVLALSDGSSKAEANTVVGGGFQTLSRVFPTDSWRRARREGISKFNETEGELLFNISKADPIGRKRARMDLALFYFGNRFAPEAMGILQTLGSDDLEVLGDPKFRLLRGGVNYALRRYKEARDDLSHASLGDNDEAAFWLAAVGAASGRAKEAVPALKELVPILRAYPRALKMDLEMLIANAAIAAGDVRMGISRLEALAKEKPTPQEVDQLANIEGKLKQLAGDFDGAVAAFRAAEEGEHRRSSAEATVARAELQLTRKKIQPRKAIEELEKLRFAWRGDELEFTLLRKLGQLYLQVDDYRNGLRTLRQAVTFFRDNPAVKDVAKEMSDAFIRLYLKDAPNNLTPVRAIALYKEFKELTPAGAQGNEITLKLADRLAEVDLLDSAAALLRQQVGFRLQGVQKARVGARLATIYLLNREPKRAEDILKKSETPGQPDDLARERRQLLAKAVVNQGRRTEGLNLIEDDESREADQLRVEAFWRAREWANAAKALQRLAARSGVRPGKDLNQEQARNVLNMAISMTLSANERGLTRLRDDHTKAMAKTTLGDAFKLIASPNSKGLIDYRNLTGQVKKATDFETFLTAKQGGEKAAQPPQTN